MTRSEEPLMRWDPGTGKLVDEHDAEITSAQETKARTILEGGLIHHIETTRPSPHYELQVYLIDPVRGCKQQRRLTYSKTTLPLGRVETRITCDWQAFRGTRNSKARVCSHALALARYLRGGVAA